MMESMKKYFPSEVLFNHPTGGLFTWVTVPDHIDTKELLARSLETIKVAFVPGASFFPNGAVKNTMRVNFSTMPDELIVEGIKRLGALLKEEM